MPYGLDRPSSDELAANAAAELERQRQKEERAEFLRTFKAGELRPTAIPELRAIITAFDQTQAYVPAALTDAQKQACPAYIAKAKLAIDRADLMGLRLALGPDLHAHWKKFLNATRSSYWDFLGKLIQLNVQQKREKTLLEFAQEQRFPEQLNQAQQAELKTQLLKAFTAEMNTPPEWRVDDSLKSMIKTALEEAYTQEHQRIEKNESSVTDLAQTLYALRKSCSVLSGEVSLCKYNQEKRVRDYASSIADDAQSTWAQFQENALSQGASVDEVQALRAARTAQVSLADIEDSAASLVDYALEKYESADAEQKAALLPLIHTIIAHGGKPSAEKRLDWEILEILLHYADAATPRAQVTSRTLMPYVRSSKEQVASFWWRIFNSPGIKEDRRVDVQAISLALCASTPSEESVSVLDQRVADAVRIARSHCQSALRGSELFSSLGEAETRLTLFRPVFSGPDVEMRTGVTARDQHDKHGDEQHPSPGAS